MVRGSGLFSAACVLAAMLAAPAGAEAARPDLGVRSANATPAELVPGGTLTVAATVRNAGRGKAKGTKLGIYLSTDATRSTEDSRLGRVRVKALARGKRAKVRRVVTTPADLTGTFRVLACADDRRKVRERSERNNCRALEAAVTITRPSSGPPAPGPGKPPVVTAPTSLRAPTDAPKKIKGVAVADPDSSSVSVIVTATNGTAVPATASGSPAAVTAALAKLTYTPPAGYQGPASVTVTASDGALSGAKTVQLTVAPNVAPTVTTTAGTRGYTENDPATAIDPGLTLTDPDADEIARASVEVSTGYAIGEDVLSLPLPPVGITAAFDAAGGTLTLTGPASPIAFQAALRAVAYANTSDAPSAPLRTLTFTVDDGIAAGTATRNLSVAAVNDGPRVTLDAPAALAYTEQSGFQPLLGAGVDVDVTDPDSPTIASVAVQIGTGFDVDEHDSLGFDGSFLPAGFFTSADPGAGLLFLHKVSGGPPAEFAAALKGMLFANGDDDPDHRNDGTPTPAAAERTIAVFGTDGTTQGAAAVRSVAILPVNDAPAAPATPVAASGIRNTTLISGTATTSDPRIVRNVVLRGDALDPDDPESELVAVPATGVSTAQGGRISLGGASDVRYEPPASLSLTSDSVSYRITDGEALSPQTTLTINLAGRIVYVADEQAGTTDGTAARPFPLISTALGAAGPDGTVHVRRGPGDGVLAGGVALQAGQKLIGQGTPLTSGDAGAGGTDTVFASQPAPTLVATGSDVVVLEDDTLVGGLRLDPNGAAGGLSGAGTAGVTLRTLTVADTGQAATQPAIELTGTGNGLAFTGNVDLTMQSASALSIVNAALSGTILNTVVTNGTAGGVSLSSTTGGLDFMNLSLTTTGPTAAFSLANAANINVLGADGTNVINATGGPAVDATLLTAGTGLHFTGVTSSGSATRGVRLSGTGNWSFGSGGAISGATVAGLEVNGGSGSVNWRGSLAASAGRTAEITQRTGTTTISGPIATTGGTGLGVIGNGPGGTTTFSGASKVLSTGSNQAVTLTGNTGHAVAFTNGGLDLHTTTAGAFTVSGGGTVTVSGSGNRADAVSNAALIISGTTIGAAGVTFERLAAGNEGPAADPVSGIVLADTGSQGGLTVTGSGVALPAGNQTGGTIQRTTGAGISLLNTRAPSFSNMLLANTAGSGVNGAGVAGFSFVRNRVQSSGLADAIGDSNLSFNDATQNLTGTATITDNALSGPRYHGIDIANGSGTIDQLTIARNDMTGSGGGLDTLGSGIRVAAGGTAAVPSGSLADNEIDDFGAGSTIELRVSQGANLGGTTLEEPHFDVTGTIADGNNSEPEHFLYLENDSANAHVNASGNGKDGDEIREFDGIVFDVRSFGDAQTTVHMRDNFLMSNNRLGAAGLSAFCAGSALNPDPDNGTIVSVITGNTVSATGASGIDVRAAESTCTQRSRIADNVVAAPVDTGEARAGITALSAGNISGPATMCVGLSGNQATGNGPAGSKAPGIRLWRGTTNNHTFQVDGLAAGATASPAVENHVNGLNPASASGTVAGSVGGTWLSDATTGFGSCTAPPA